MAQASTPKALAWLRAARLQFYPMVVILYAVGAAIGELRTGALDWTAAILGWLCLFFIELATVLTNEHFDYEGDRANRNAGPFTGGSRVLVDGQLSFREVRSGIATALVALAVVAALLLVHLPAPSRALVGAWLALGVVLSLGYTAPPLRLSYRGLGELDVAFTHSAYVIVAGFAVQAGQWRDPLPWMVSLPAFFAVLAANTLAGIPDHAADASVDKRSCSVLFGRAAAARIAAATALAAAVAGVGLWAGGVVGGRVGLVFLATAVHAVALCWVLVSYIRSGGPDRRIDSVMVNALNFILWFGLIPLVYFVSH
ncbi:MAG: prenyltransferase [Candidatus Krumholzibacteria bacterium]|nr:prenyltransferase [Candidatus Krumholzibacteria bacterium]